MGSIGKKICFFALTVCSFFCISTVVFAESVNPDDLIKKIAPDGKNAIFKMKKPTTVEEGEFAVNGYVNNVIGIDGYEIYAGCYNEPYTTCDVEIINSDSGNSKRYEIDVTYDEPKSNIVIDNYFKNLKDISLSNPETFFMVEDLSLINYYLTSNKSELWNPGAPGRALKYSTINNITSGANISYYIDIRAGSQDETLMYENAFGPMSVFYNGYSYGTKEQGLYLKRVINIPENTADTKEAYIQAAQERINKYLGNESVKVTYGGLLSSLPADAEDHDYPVANDGNYYNIKIGDRTYKFYIVKALSDKLVDPTYIGTDINSKIEITSDDSSIPLDTSLTVKNVNDDSVKEKLGIDNYVSYDISLYSDASSSKIEKLPNGKFLVKIPIPTELNGKELTVYYITSEGKIEEHIVTIKDGLAIFETNHFSTYTLTEKKTIDNIETAKDVSNEEIKNPQTYDGLINWIILSIVSLSGIVGIITYRKKQNI